MRGTVRSWTRVDRPPSGFAPGRVIVLVACEDGASRYALWERGEPRVDGPATLVERDGVWHAA